MIERSNFFLFYVIMEKEKTFIRGENMRIVNR